MKRFFRIIALVTLLIFVDVSVAQGEALPDSVYISGVSGHAQGYSLSCEARSAADWAAFWGVSIGETEFLETLPNSDNPDEGYVGNPNDAWGLLPPHGYGVHAAPVAEILRDFGLEAEAHHDLSWDDLREEIKAGRPVIVWVIGSMWGGTPVEYEAPDGSTSRVAAFEHTMILTGYSLDAVQVVDAYTGQYQTYWLKTFLKSWGVLGNMAVFGSPKASQDDETQPEIHGETYTVQPGDYLVALAGRFDSTWQELAELNSIGYPYNIYAGQVLKLPGGEAQEPEAEAAPEPEPGAAEPAPKVEAVNFQARLPMVQRNFAIQTAPSATIHPVMPKHAETVIVMISNTLVNFCKSLGVDWRQLAQLNDLHPPYLVHPGQVLRLR